MVGTIFEDSPIPLTKWLPSVWLISSNRNGISSYEIARGLGVTQHGLCCTVSARPCKTIRSNYCRERLRWTKPILAVSPSA